MTRALSPPAKHALGWLLYLTYAMLEDGLDPTWLGLAYNVSHALALASAFYTGYLLFWPRYATPPRWIGLAAGFLSGALAFTAVRYLLQEALSRALLGFGNYHDPTFWHYVTDNVYRPLPVILASLAVWAFGRQARAEREREALAVEMTRAELAWLRSQINPHFLFNTLGFLHARAYAFDETMAEMIEELSTILRRAFRGTPEGTVPLREEWETIRALDGIFRKRFPDRHRVVLALTGEHGGPPAPAELERRVEPMLLMTFAENLYKHGDLSEDSEPARIAVRLLPGGLEAEFDNAVQNGTPPTGHGIGLANARRRLELAYPGRHALRAGREGPRYRVRLTLQDPAA